MSAIGHDIWLFGRQYRTILLKKQVIIIWQRDCT